MLAFGLKNRIFLRNLCPLDFCFLSLYSLRGSIRRGEWLCKAHQSQTSLLADLRSPLFFGHLQKAFALLLLPELIGTHLWTSLQTRFPHCLGSMRFLPDEPAPSLPQGQLLMRAAHLREEPLDTRSRASVRRREEKRSISGLDKAPSHQTRASDENLLCNQYIGVSLQ